MILSTIPNLCRPPSRIPRFEPESASRRSREAGNSLLRRERDVATDDRQIPRCRKSPRARSWRRRRRLSSRSFSAIVSRSATATASPLKERAISQTVFSRSDSTMPKRRFRYNHTPVNTHPPEAPVTAIVCKGSSRAGHESIRFVVQARVRARATSRSTIRR